MVNEVSGIMIDMMGNEGTRSYELKLHKSALRDQLACLLKEDKEADVLRQLRYSINPPREIQ